MIVRSAVAGRSGPASLSAAVAFAVVTAGLAVASGWRPGRVSGAAVAMGLGGGLLLVAGPLIARTGPPPAAGATTARVGWWVVVVSAVAVSEELLLRGALWEHLQVRAGAPAALIATTVIFAMMHVPLYGWQALPLDLAVGMLLGGLRIITSGVTAPAVAHLVADVAGGWI